MLLGPVFQADVVTTARQKRYYWLRALFAALLLLCLWLVYLGVSDYNRLDRGLSIREAAQLASGFFNTFAWISMLLTLLVAPAIAAGAIATERERRTIEYLFATDLSNAEIVLSKLFGKLLLVGKLMLVALPVLAIFRMLGGIPGSLLLMFFAMLASTATLVTVGAMTISVWTPRARDALVRVYLVEAIVFFLPFFLWIFGVGGGIGGPAVWIANYMQWCFAINPLLVMLTQMTGGGLGVGFGAWQIWQMVIYQLVVSAILCFIAVVAVRRVHLRAVSSGGDTEPNHRWSLPKFRPNIGDRPMVWKELFARAAGTKLGILGRICVAVIMLSMMGVATYYYIEVWSEILSRGNSYSYMRPGQKFAGVSITITVITATGAVLLMGLRAAGLVTNEKERDCWLSLISTPLTGQEIITAKTIGNFYAFRWLLVPLGIVWLMQASLSPQYVLSIPFHLLTICITGLFATVVGLAYSMKFKGSMKSISATIGTLVFVGGGYMMCCCMPMMISGGSEEALKVAVSGVVPFLHAVPGIAAIDDGNDAVEMLVPYVLGNIFYFFVSCVILTTLFTSFDQMVGRTGHNFEGPNLGNPRTTANPFAEGGND